MKRILIILFALGLCTSVTQAQTWQGGAAGYWGDPANWNAGGTDYLIDGGTQTITLSDSAASTPGGYVYNINTLELRNVTNVTLVSAGTGADFKGTLNITDRIRTNGNGLKSLVIGDAADPTKNNLAINSDKLIIGQNNSNNNVTVTQNGGDVRFTSSNQGNTNAPMVLGHWPNHTGQYVLNGGTLEVKNGFTIVPWDGTGHFTVNGGTATLWHPTERPGWNRTSHYTLTGGSLILGSHTDQFYNSNSISLGGGTLGAYADWRSIRPATLTGVNGNVTFDTTGGQITWTGVLSGPGGLEHDGTGTLILSGDNTYAGTTTITNGTLQVGDNGASGQLGADTITIAAGATLDYRRTGDFTLANQITGGGDFVQNETGTITFTADNDYSGRTIINSGALQIGTGGAVGQIGTGEVQLSAGTQLDFQRTGVCNVLGRITGAGDVHLNGTGEVVFAADNDYTGTTFFNAGTLVLGNGGASGTLGTGATLTIPGGSVLAYNRSDIYVAAKSFNGAGGLEQRGTGTLTLTANNSYTGLTTITAGTLVVGDGGTTGTLGTMATQTIGAGATLAYNRSDDIIMSKSFSGAGNFEQRGTGTLTLTGTNSYTGGTTIAAGTLRIGASDAISANTSSLTIAAAGTLETQGFDATVGTLDVAGTLDGGAGTTGTVTTTGGSVTGTLTGKTNLTTNGTLTSTGTLSYSGTTTITAGTLDVDGAIYDGQDVADFIVGADATLDLTDASMTLAGGTQRFQIDATHGPLTTVATPTVPFDLSLATMQLSGTYGYTAAKIRQFYGAGGLDTLVMSSNTPLQITINGTDAGTIAASKLTVTTAMTLDPNRLTIRLSNFGDTATSFTVLEVESLNDIETPGGQGWSTLGDLSVYNWTPAYDVPAGMTVRYEMGPGLLIGHLEGSGITGITGTNIEATAIILTSTPPAGSDTETAQGLLNAATTDKKRDQITQQFTPSMAIAQAAQAVQGNSQLLQTVADQVVVPWEGGYAGGVNVLRANNRKRPRDRSINTWFQGFGYTGEQAVKDNFAGYKNNGSGLAVGADRTFGPRVVAGLAYGYAQSFLDSTPFITGSETPSNVNTNGHSLVGYAMMRTSCSTFLTFKGGNTWYATEGVRRPFTSDPSRIYTYNTDANTWYLQATLGWQWLRETYFTLTPKARLAYFSYSQDAYEEIRPSLPPASVDAYSNDYTQADFLLDLQVFLSKKLTLNTSVGYRSLTGAEGAVMGYAADGLSYNVQGVAPADQQILLDTGLLFKFNKSLLLITEYNFRAGQGSHLHGGTGSLVLTF